MSKSKRRTVLIIFFLFGLFHQADRFLIGPLTSSIINEFHINEAQMGFSISSAIIVAGILYPIWGYLSDKFNRAKLISLASFLWGSTTWLSSVAKSYGMFVITRASTGIDDAAYPGLYSLLSDYFEPLLRSRVFSVIKITFPLGYVVGAMFGTLLGARFGFRKVFLITGVIGILFSVLILLFVKDVPRGASENKSTESQITFNKIKELLKSKAHISLYAQGFFAVFPMNIITFWLFRYLEVERTLNSKELVLVSVIAVGFIALGNIVSGFLGDKMFSIEKTGRLKVGLLTVLGAGLLIIAILTPISKHLQFLVFVAVGSFFVAFATPNVSATISDISNAEVRSTALSMQSFVETLGSALSPTIAGFIAYKTNLTFTFVSVLALSSVFWLIAFVFAISSIRKFYVSEDVRRIS